jgi:phytoene/squalene synthetase
MAASDVLVASEQLEASDEMKELLVTVARFHIPAWPLQAFAKSMIYDIYNDGFPTLDAFLDYASGASVAPAAIFVHLCGLKKVDDSYEAPAFDVKNAAASCAIFSYLVHIIRDFVKDHTHNLNYFPKDLMLKNNLDRQNLLAMAQGAPITAGFRKMIAELYKTADIYRLKTLETIKEIKPQVEPRSQLSLEIIFALYTMVFERIDIATGTFTTAELNPTAEEIRQRVWSVIAVTPAQRFRG